MINNMPTGGHRPLPSTPLAPRRSLPEWVAAGTAMALFARWAEVGELVSLDDEAEPA